MCKLIIAGVASPLGSWKRWPRGLLDPHLNLESDDSETKETVKHSVSQTFTERNGIITAVLYIGV